MRASLAALVGQDDPARIAVADALPALEAVPAVEDALIAAGRDRPDLAAARAMERAADRRAAAEVRGTLPDVGLSGGYKGTGGYSTTTIGVILTAPLLNLNGGNRERSAGELLMASADSRAVELRVGTEVRAAIERRMHSMTARAASTPPRRPRDGGLRRSLVPRGRRLARGTARCLPCRRRRARGLRARHSRPRNRPT
jgi:outer membrane protein TolC